MHGGHEVCQGGRWSDCVGARNRRMRCATNSIMIVTAPSMKTQSRAGSWIRIVALRFASQIVPIAHGYGRLSAGSMDVYMHRPVMHVASRDSPHETCPNALISEMKIEHVKSMMTVNSPARVSVSVSLKTLRSTAHLNLVHSRSVLLEHLSADASIIDAA